MNKEFVLEKTGRDYSEDTDVKLESEVTLISDE